MQVPDEAVQAALARRADLLADRPDPTALSEETLVKLMLETAAPILAEAWKPKRPARKPKREVLARCQWCFKHNRTASEWEQQSLKGVWHRLCVRCANRRLDNPWNALLPMRKIGSEENDSAPAGAVKEDEGHG